MLKKILISLALFTSCMSLGFINQLKWNNTTNDETRFFLNRVETAMANEHLVLRFTNSDGSTYVYNVDSNTLEESPNVMTTQGDSSEGRLIKELLIYHYGFGPALVGALGVPSIASISKSTSLWNNFKGIRGGTIARITLEVVSGYAFGAILANHYLQETVEYSHLKAKFNQPEFWHDIERDLFAQQYKILLRKPTSDFLTCKLPNDRGHLTICKNHFLLALESLCIKYSEACGRELASTRHDLSLKIEKVAKQVKQDLSENGAVDPFFKFLRLDPNDGFYYSDMRGVQGKSVIIF